MQQWSVFALSKEFDMSRTPARFTQADIARAMRANIATGSQHVLDVTLDGRMRFVPVEHVPTPQNDDRKALAEDPRLESWDA
jgi:hypothetical protein